MMGSPRAQAMALVVLTPTSSEPASPGPRVTARAERSSHPAPESASAAAITGTMS